MPKLPARPLSVAMAITLAGVSTAPAFAVTATPTPSPSVSVSPSADPSADLSADATSSPSAPSTSPTSSPSADATPEPSDSPSSPAVNPVEVSLKGSDVSARELDGKFFFTELAPLVVSLGTADASSAVGDVVISVNGKAVFSQAVKSDSLSHEVPISEEGEYKVSVTVDGKSVFDEVYVFDSTAPVAVLADLSSTPTTEDGVSYVTSGTSVVLIGVSDPKNGSGVSKIEFQHSDTESGTYSTLVTNEAPNLTANPYTLDKSGFYRFVLTDNLGNATTIPLSDLNKSLAPKIEVGTAQDADISVVVNGSAVDSEKWLRDSADARVTVSTKSLRQNNTIEVNGQQVLSERVSTPGDKTYDLNLLDTPSDSGIYTVKVSTTSIFGGATSSQEFTVKVDTASPTLTDVTLQGDYQVIDGVMYATSPISGTIRVSDAQSGVSAVTLNNSPLSETDTSGIYSFTLNEGASFVFGATDNVGHVSTSTLTELGYESGVLEIDSDAPVLTPTDVPEPTFTDSSSRGWVSKAPTVSFEVADSNLESATITANGKVLSELSSSGTLTADLSTVTPDSSGAVNAVIRATDKAGSVTERTVTYYVDSTAPTDLTASLSGEVFDRGFGVFARQAPTLSVGASDSASGIATYRLVDSAGAILLETSNPSSLTIPAGATYLEVVDNVGNVSARLALTESLGISSLNVQVDTSNPTLNVSRTESPSENWVRDSATWNVSFMDNLSIFNVKVDINGSNVFESTETSLRTERSFQVSTEGLTPNADGSFTITITGIDSAGNTVTYTDTVRVDKDAPTVDRFVFNNEVFNESDAVSNDQYGYFFQGATGVTIYASDVSSGVSEITYTLRNADGSVHSSQTLPASGSQVYVTIPENFKGFISANATDRVGITGDTAQPSGIITESRNWFVNTSSIAINLPGTEFTDASGEALYNSDVTASFNVAQSTAGIRSVEWGVNDQTLGSSSVGIDGSVSGGLTAGSFDRNLVTSVSGSLTTGTENQSQRVWVRATDRAGHTSEQSRVFSIDKTAPVIDVAYNQTRDSGFYNSDRVATVTITEANFDPSAVRFFGNAPAPSAWRNVAPGVHVADVVFANDGEYTLGVSYTDRAGNSAREYNSGSFTIDKTVPVIDVSFDNNDVANGKYYAGARTATVTVNEANFDPALVEYVGDGSLTGFTQTASGAWVSTVTFDSDGAHAFRLSTRDKAENVSSTFDSGEFIVNTVKPAINISGVQGGVSYKDSVSLNATLSGKYIDTSRSTFEVVGRKNGVINTNTAITSDGGTAVWANIPRDKGMDDEYTVKAVLLDLSGNRVEEEFTFVVNRFGSDFTFSNDDFEGKFYQELPADVSMTQVSPEKGDLSKSYVRVLKDGREVSVPDSQKGISDTSTGTEDYQYTATVNKDFFTDDGVYQVQFFATSAYGTEENTLSQEYSFGIDKTPAEVIISGIKDNGSQNAVTQEVAVEVRDLSGVSSIEATMNDKPVELIERDGKYYTTLRASSDYQNFNVKVVDNAGNVSESAVSNFYLATNPVEAAIHSPWIRLLAGLVFSALAIFLVLLAKRRKDSKEPEIVYISDDSSTSGASQTPGVSSFSSGAVAPVLPLPLTPEEVESEPVPESSLADVESDPVSEPEIDPADEVTEQDVEDMLSTGFVSSQAIDSDEEPVIESDKSHFVFTTPEAEDNISTGYLSDADAEDDISTTFVENADRPNSDS